MKNWLYLPFLLLMAITYNQLAINFESVQPFSSVTRAPAAMIDAVQAEECIDLPNQFNPHYVLKGCL